MPNNEEFKQIDDIAKYVIDGTRDGNLVFEEVKKFERIVAVQGTEGQKVQTILKDGTVETNERTVEIDEKTGNPGWIVQNMSTPEKWIVTDSTFQKKYEMDPEQPGVFKPKGGPMLAARLNENVSFAPPNWNGDIINVLAGGCIVMDPANPTDIYGIDGDVYDLTYAPATGELYGEIHPTWSRDELDSLFLSNSDENSISLEDYLKISACTGYRDSVKTK